MPETSRCRSSVETGAGGDADVDTVGGVAGVCGVAGWFVRWVTGASLLAGSEPVDRRHRDLQPGRSVAGLVEDLVDGLVGLVRAQQDRLLPRVRATCPGVA